MFNKKLVKMSEVEAKMEEMELDIYFLESHVEDLKSTVHYYKDEINDMTNALLVNIDDIYEYDKETGEPYFTADVIKDYTEELTRGIDLVDKAQRDLEEAKMEYVNFMTDFQNWLKERVGDDNND